MTDMGSPSPGRMSSHNISSQVLYGCHVPGGVPGAPHTFLVSHHRHTVGMCLPCAEMREVASTETTTAAGEWHSWNLNRGLLGSRPPQTPPQSPQCGLAHVFQASEHPGWEGVPMVISCPKFMPGQGFKMAPMLLSALCVKDGAGEPESQSRGPVKGLGPRQGLLRADAGAQGHWTARMGGTLALHASFPSPCF